MIIYLYNMDSYVSYVFQQGQDTHVYLCVNHNNPEAAHFNHFAWLEHHFACTIGHHTYGYGLTWCSRGVTQLVIRGMVNHRLLDDLLVYDFELFPQICRWVSRNPAFYHYVPS